ncbi:hypothetical protein IAD21_00131 [Abditibacteriota bacterium]|nr:hypothetical protein IAD21_00131 [Abditibacteriota bacterium]
MENRAAQNPIKALINSKFPMNLQHTIMVLKRYNLPVLCVLFALLPSSAQCSNLLQFDFNGPNPWPQAVADVMPSTPIDLTTTFEVGAVGTADAAKPETPTGGLLLGAEVGEVNLDWSAIFMSGLLPVTNAETDLSRLKMALNLSASTARPVRLQIESFNTKKRRSGGLETVIEPKDANSYEHYDLALSSFKAVGGGRFAPTDPFIQFTFILGAPAWSDNANHQIRIDELTYDTSESNTSPQDAAGSKR